ncbi:MAG: hypothetical protein ACYC5O_03805 [Anaerolineae bacterium]
MRRGLPPEDGSDDGEPGREPIDDPEPSADAEAEPAGPGLPKVTALFETPGRPSAVAALELSASGEATRRRQRCASIQAATHWDVRLWRRGGCR